VSLSGLGRRLWHCATRRLGLASSAVAECVIQVLEAAVEPGEVLIQLRAQPTCSQPPVIAFENATREPLSCDGFEAKYRIP
jgi:hypothetical protein